METEQTLQIALYCRLREVLKEKALTGQEAAAGRLCPVPSVLSLELDPGVIPLSTLNLAFWLACHLPPAPFTRRGSGLSYRAPEDRQMIDVLQATHWASKEQAYLLCKTGEGQRPIRRRWEDLKVQNFF